MIFELREKFRRDSPAVAEVNLRKGILMKKKRDFKPSTYQEQTQLSSYRR